MNKLEISPDGGVLLNGIQVNWCLGLDIKNIDPIKGMEVALHIAVDEIDAKYKVKVD